MIYRRFGRTNLQIPVFSCGGMRYQHKWQDVPLSEIPADNQANLEATIRRSVEVGINHIETARGYGSSERQLGLILPKFPREKLIVQTKVGPCADPDEFTRNFEESLSRLQLQRVDLLAIHGLNDDQTIEWSIRKNGCLAAARKIQQRGLAGHIGFSTHGMRDQIIRAIGHEGDGGFDYVNLHWYYINQHNWPAVLEATRRDIGVFIISPSDKGGLLYKPSDKLVELCKPIHPIIFNDLFCLMHPEVHTLSVGASRPGDFDLHVQAAELLSQAKQIVPPIEAKLQAEFEKHVPSHLRDALAKLPDHRSAPGGLALGTMLWLRNLAVAFDMLEYGKMRYNLLGNGGNWFPGKNAGEIDQFDLSSIAKSAGIAELNDLLKQAHQMLWKEPVKRLSQS